MNSQLFTFNLIISNLSHFRLKVQSVARGVRYVNMGVGFFTGYRKNVIEADEILVSFFVPITEPHQFFLAYKQAKRRDDDIAIVNLALNVKFTPSTDKIEYLNMSFGGMAPTIAMTPNTCAAVIGKNWNNELIEIVSKELVNELPLPPSAPGGHILYRRSLTLSLFFKGFLHISQALEHIVTDRKPLAAEEKSGSHLFHTLQPKSAQFYEKVPDDQTSHDPVGRPNVHVSAYKQTTGEAIYIDDMPKWKNELYLALVLSTKAHAKILNIDATEALKVPGVHRFFSHKDMSEHVNEVGPIVHDERVFQIDTVTSQGQTIGAIVADDQAIAQKAARMVNIEYEDISPIIITIEDAIKQESFFGEKRVMQRGNVEQAFTTSDHVIEGETRMGGQEHFYLETHAAIAIPRDTDEIEIFCSSQHPTEIQKLVAHITGLPSARISARVKRMGGGFGGKESRGMLVALPVAFAAYSMNRPIRCMLDRDEDMMISGTRHPFLFKVIS